MRDSIGTRIKVLRKRLNLSQSEFCNEFIDRTTLSKLEKDIIVPSVQFLLYIAKRFNLSMNYFFDDNISEAAGGMWKQEIDLLESWYGNGYHDKLIEFHIKSYIQFKVMDDINKYYYTGMAYVQTKNDNKAVTLLKSYTNEYLNSSIEKQSENAEKFAMAAFHFYRIMYYKNKTNNLEDKLLMAKQVLETYNKEKEAINFIIHNVLAMLYRSKGQFDKCINLLENFLSKSDNLIYLRQVIQMHLGLNLAYLNIGNYDKAIEHIKKVIYLDQYSGNNDVLPIDFCNYISALRYNKQYEEAFILLEKCKIEFKENENAQVLYQLVESIIYFNMEEYSKTLEVLLDIPFNKLDAMERNDFYFLRGHLHFLNNEFEYAKDCLLKCEEHYLTKRYNYDLVLIYKDLYEITKEPDYEKKHIEFKEMYSERNILV